MMFGDHILSILFIVKVKILDVIKGLITLATSVTIHQHLRL